MMEPLRRQWLPLHLLCLPIVWDLSGIWAAPVNIWNIWTIFIIVRTRYFTDNVFNTLADDLNFWRRRIHLGTPPCSRVAVEKKIMIIPSRPLPHYVLKPNAAKKISITHKWVWVGFSWRYQNHFFLTISDTIIFIILIVIIIIFITTSTPILIIVVNIFISGTMSTHRESSCTEGRWSSRPRSTPSPTWSSSIILIFIVFIIIVNMVDNISWSNCDYHWKGQNCLQFDNLIYHLTKSAYQ